MASASTKKIGCFCENIHTKKFTWLMKCKSK